jgi:hypothetical protein
MTVEIWINWDQFLTLETWSECLLSITQTTNAGKDVEEKEHFYNVVENVN